MLLKARRDLPHRGLDTGLCVLYMFPSVLDIVKKTGAALGVGVRLVSPREKLLRVSARICVFEAAGIDAKFVSRDFCPDCGEILSALKRLGGEQDSEDSVLGQCLVSCLS